MKLQMVVEQKLLQYVWHNMKYLIHGMIDAGKG